jgi:hypothetical protein
MNRKRMIIVGSRPITTSSEKGSITSVIKRRNLAIRLIVIGVGINKKFRYITPKVRLITGIISSEI